MIRSQWCVAMTVALGVLAVPLSAQSPAAGVGVALRIPDKSTIATMEKSIPELMRQGTVPGVSVAVIRDGKTFWLHAFGVRNAKTGEPVIDGTIFEAASLSKPVFAYAVLKLVDQGKLDLDTPLTKYLPAPYSEGDGRLDKITARYVLSHRTGFDDSLRAGAAIQLFG